MSPSKETKQPLVSIVIPCYNQACYLAACVDHCLFQTYQNLEIIIVDGGSTDTTKEYLENLPANIAEATVNPVAKLSNKNNIIRQQTLVYPQNRQLKILTFADNIGATRTYNEGFQRLTGKYCTYIVGDDLPHPQMISEMVTILEQGQADFVYSDMNVVNDNNEIIRQMILPNYSFQQCLARWYHLGVSRLYRASLHHQVGLMDERYKSANDYDHHLRFAMHGARFYHLAKVLYSVRHHGHDRQTGQHTSANYQNLLNESKQCAIRARQWLQEQGAAQP